MIKRKIFEDYIEENIDKAFRFAYSYSGNKSDAEDVVSESVVKALSKISSLRDTEKINCWFMSIIANTAKQNLRRQKKFVFESEDSAEKIAAKEESSFFEFEDLIKNLDVKYRELLIMKYFEGFTFKEISEISSLSENTVKTRLYRAIELLKPKLEGELK